MLLRNLPRLGGYTQRVHPGAHLVRDLQQLRILVKSTERPHPVRQGSTRPFITRGLDGGRSIYLPTEWGLHVRVTTLLGDSATTTRRLGCTRKGSSVDQDERFQLEAQISRDLNRPSSL